MSQTTEQDFDLFQDAMPPHTPWADGENTAITPVRIPHVLPPPTSARSMVGQTVAKFAKLSAQTNPAAMPPAPTVPQAGPQATPTPTPSCLRSTRSEKNIPSADKGKGRASAALGPLPPPPPVQNAPTPTPQNIPQGIVESLQSLTVMDTSLKSNLPAIRADMQLLGTTVQHLLRTQTSDRAESRTAIAALFAASDSTNERVGQAGSTPGHTTERLQCLEARIDSLAVTVERNEAALNTEFTMFQDHHDDLAEDYSRLSRTLATVVNTLADLTLEVRGLALVPPPGPAAPTVVQAPVAQAPSDTTHAALPTAPSAPGPTYTTAQAALPTLPTMAMARAVPRFRPLRTPAVIRPASTQASQSPDVTHEAPAPQPRSLRRRPLEAGFGAGTMRAKRPRLDTTATTTVAHMPVARPSRAPATSSSLGGRVRFGSIGWGPDPVTLRQQVYTVALPVWEVDFALFACLNSVEFDPTDNTYVTLIFPARDDAQAFVDLWFANRVKSVAYARAQAHVV